MLTMPVRATVLTYCLPLGAERKKFRTSGLALVKKLLAMLDIAVKYKPRNTPAILATVARNVSTACVSKEINEKDLGKK